MAEEKGPLNCSSELSADYFGEGVRLGIYLIWLTSWVANNFVPDEISGAQDANAIFLLALLVSIFKGSAVDEADRLRYIDGLVLMQLCAGYMFGCFSMWGYRTCLYNREGRRGVRHFGRIGTHSRLILMTAISAYGIWFWIEGIEDGLAPLRDENGRYRDECYPLETFFFAKLPVRGGIRYWYIFITVSCTLYYGLMLFVAVLERGMRAWGSKKLFTVGTYETGLNHSELRLIFLFCRWGNFIWIAFSIIMVELTLNWNHVENVVGNNGHMSYPAQLLPLIIGILGFVRILYIVYRDYRPHKVDQIASAEEGQAANGLGAQPEKETAEGGEDHSYCGSDEVPEDFDINVRDRSLTLRYLIAWLPWLSVSELWRKPQLRRDMAAAGMINTEPTNRNSTQPLMEATPAGTPATATMPQFENPREEEPMSPTPVVEKTASSRVYDLVTSRSASSSSNSKQD